MEKKKAFAYLRVSSRGQVDGHGFDRQEETVRAFAKRNGIEIVAVYRDAHTGTEADRPAFAEMIGALNGVRTILVESADRLARDLMVQTLLLAKLAELGVALISTTTGADLAADAAQDPMTRAMVQIQGVFAELDKRLLVRKLRKAREAKRQATGRCEGRKPYGDRPGEADTLARILDLRRGHRGKARMPFEEIAATLNAEGRVSRTGKPWLPSVVYRIVRARRPQLARA